MEIIEWPSSVAKPGDVYGRLTILSTHKQGTKRYLAKCQCNCGSNPFFVRIDALRKQGTPGHPRTRSCGCLSVETATSHGATYHPVFNAWHHMMQRCYNPKRANYKYYGARGITVCEQWHDVRSFITDMAKGYIKGLQLERIDNNKNYEPSNCRWATRLEQMQNTRHNHLITYEGKTLCLSEWARIHNLQPLTLLSRIKSGKLNLEQCLTTPVYKTRGLT